MIHQHMVAEVVELVPKTEFDKQREANKNTGGATSLGGGRNAYIFKLERAAVSADGVKFEHARLAWHDSWPSRCTHARWRWRGAWCCCVEDALGVKGTALVPGGAQGRRACAGLAAALLQRRQAAGRPPLQLAACARVRRACRAGAGAAGVRCGTGRLSVLHLLASYGGALGLVHSGPSCS